MNYKKIRRRQKVGEILPVDDISIEEFKQSTNLYCSCSNPYIIKTPLLRIEKLPRYYHEFCYTCLNCGWESIKLRKRTL